MAARLRPPPRLTIFERAKAPAAHWNGDPLHGLGYTDGVQELCSEPTRDLAHGMGDWLGRELADFARPYRWERFAKSNGLPTKPDFRPKHEQFASYVRWALETIEQEHEALIELRLGETVTRLIPHRAHWSLTTDSGNTAESFDAVVVTSPGPSNGRIARCADPVARASCYDAQNYWSKGRRTIANESRVIIVGGGGAAAAIALDILEGASESNGRSVVLVAPSPTMFTRGESRFEHELLTSVRRWTDLTAHQRSEGLERLVSGVVFRRILERLEEVPSPEHVIGHVRAVVAGLTRIDDGAGEMPLEVHCQCETAEGPRLRIVHGTHVVDATGFDATWFRSLLDDRLARALMSLGTAGLASHVDEHLRLCVSAQLVDFDDLQAIPLLRASPALHTPMLAGGRQPPGFASLLCLGRMAETLFWPHIIR